MLKVVEDRGVWTEQDGTIIHDTKLIKQDCINPNCVKYKEKIKLYFPSYFISSTCPGCKSPLHGTRYMDSEYVRLGYHLT